MSVNDHWIYLFKGITQKGGFCNENFQLTFFEHLPFKVFHWNCKSFNFKSCEYKGDNFQALTTPTAIHSRERESEREKRDWEQQGMKDMKRNLFCVMSRGKRMWRKTRGTFSFDGPVTASWSIRSFLFWLLIQSPFFVHSEKLLFQLQARIFGIFKLLFCARVYLRGKLKTEWCVIRKKVKLKWQTIQKKLSNHL